MSATPGPWTVEVWGGEVFVYGGPNGDDIATFYFRECSAVKITREEAIANALLFVASRGMLAALKDVLRWHDCSDDLHKPLEIRSAYLRARAAIAHAEEIIP